MFGIGDSSKMITDNEGGIYIDESNDPTVTEKITEQNDPTKVELVADDELAQDEKILATVKAQDEEAFFTKENLEEQKLIESIRSDLKRNIR